MDLLLSARLDFSSGPREHILKSEYEHPMAPYNHNSMSCIEDIFRCQRIHQDKK